MPIMRATLYRYIAREIIPTFAAGMFLAVFTVVATRLLSITELIITRGVGIKSIAGMVGYLLPDVIGFALPATTLIAVVMAFLRMSADSEIIALRASGVSLYQMLPPVVVFSLAVMLAGSWIGTTASPWGQKSFRDLLFRIAQSQADVAIKERVFSEPFNGIVFYVHSYDNRDRVMKDVFVTDRREKAVTSTIVAREARFFHHPGNRIITIQFANGTVFVTDKNLSSSRTIRFSSYDLTIGLKEVLAALSSRERSPGEMTVRELLVELRSAKNPEMRYNEMIIALLEKASIPMAIFFMGIAGVPLGVHMRGRGRYTGVGVSLCVFLAYYLCLVGSRNIGESGYIPPALGVWIPVVFLAASGLYALGRVGAERPLIPGLVQGIWSKLSLRFSKGA
ncbi:MAG: LPS export ABC transporter permease LptF [Desulfobacteraceae bacterium]|nr:MAG: LPS export ABC transporter permease LptF [Desulfobacteraceae bacterium]